jgi:hypothetical protein
MRAKRITSEPPGRRSPKRGLLPVLGAENRPSDEVICRTGVSRTGVSDWPGARRAPTCDP